MKEPKNFREYVKNEPAAKRAKLNQMRAAIRKAAPGCGEKMAWGMPTFTLEGNLIHIAAFTNHVSVFPGPDAIAFFKTQLAKYKTSKGTWQISLDEKVPLALLTRMTKFCVKRNRLLSKKRSQTKKARR
jgi:uncharacterized protein YdhG (YjbR/CyaY superfamily)